MIGRPGKHVAGRLSWAGRQAARLNLLRTGIAIGAAEGLVEVAAPEGSRNPQYTKLRRRAHCRQYRYPGNCGRSWQSKQRFSLTSWMPSIQWLAAATW